MKKHSRTKKNENFNEFFKVYRWWILAAVLIILAVILISSLINNAGKDKDSDKEQVVETDAFYAMSFGPEKDDNVPFSEESIIDSPPIN